MDRKAWIVITLCGLGMAANYWFATKNQEAELARRALEEANKPQNTQVQPATPGVATAGTDGSATTTPTLDAASPDVVAAAKAHLPEETHSVVTGSVTYHFTTKGAGVARAELAAGDKLTLNDGRTSLEPVGALRREPTGLDVVPYSIVEKSDKGVTFEGTTADGIKVRKAYRLTEGERSDEHLLALTLTLTNTGTAQHKSEEYYLYTGAARSISPGEVLKPSFFWNDGGDADYKDTGWFAGGWFSSQKTEHRASHTRLRYAGVMSRFYATIVSRVTPGGDKPGKIWATRFLVDHSGDRYANDESAAHDFGVEASMSLPQVDLAPGASMTEEYEIYLGPKEYHRLDRLEGQRDFIMFYGTWIGWISKILNTIMRWMHDISGNWGVAIILLTLVIRTVLWPLQSKAQYSMKRMSLLGPKMKELQAKYKDDPQKQQMEVMKLYKDYGVNPIGGCFPMLLQIPIFFAFYGVLQNAAELRGQGWLWVKDLSIADTIYTINFPFSLPLMGTDFDINPLPLIMGVTMILQMKLTPQPATVDRSQKIMFAIMPFFFLFISYNFAAALSLYWSTQNLFAIFQSRIMKLYMKDPVLEKVERTPKGPAPKNPFFNPMNPQHKDKKTKSKNPKLGG